MDPFDYGQVFLDSTDDPIASVALFEEWLRELEHRPLWSPSEPEGRRIPWRLAGAAARAFKHVLVRPGCYLFSGNPTSFSYVGETGQKGKAVATLDDRLFGRYLTKSMKSSAKVLPQFLLAEKFEDAIRLNGFEAFPEELLASYRKSFSRSRSYARLQGAVDLVERGLDGVWLTVLPLDDRCQTKALERFLIAQASRWNALHGCVPLCQTTHGYEYDSHLDGARPK